MSEATPRFRCAWLHIGLGKTGSTAVQAQLLASAAVLERSGLHYPRHFPHLRAFGGNHSPVLRGLFDTSTERSRILTMLGLRSEAALQRFNRQSLDCLRRGFESSEAPQLLLSAEGVGHFPRPALQALAAWLGEIAEEVRVVACVRHPLDALSSEIQQRLTAGAVLETLYADPPVYPLRKLFTRLADSFGEDSLVLYDFAGATCYPGGLAAALLEHTGVAVHGLAPEPPRANPSMSHEAALLLSALNAQRGLFAGGGRNPERAPDDVQRIASLPGRKFSAPPAVYALVEQRMADDLAWLEARHKLVLSAPERPAADNEDPGFSQADIDDLALRLADEARLRYALSSPLRLPARYLRQWWRRLRSCLPGAEG
ncbi:hypothetical protein E4634_15155 [Mangrovimicrobium sediminis]|uniref:Sulfotransferase family protein n=1 Tax=Mangrovimicrobium sediminis TaxID=2562682 RepID=A0A4Z0LY86_9GAMM|nr:hypothetical protein [Haliea sp. SAOS-164]TGD72302.1 hypothetical protein E4634_15155 [Haliea sp. SAOS-164]